MTQKPQILICNDDGITAPGILTLIEAAKEFGDVTVVAPDSPQSGMGHAITVGEPLRFHEHDLGVDVPAYACSGTPVDCVKIATGVILDRKPDLLLSGINHGYNYSISVVYSGTMSAAMEGAIEGIPSIGFSLGDFSWKADFSAAKEICRAVIRKALHAPMPIGTLLNVNIPKIPLEEIKGFKVARQANGRWIENFDEREDPHGRRYFWLKGCFKEEDDGPDTDTWALNNGYVSVVPVKFDLTAHHAMATFNQWNLQLS